MFGCHAATGACAYLFKGRALPKNRVSVVQKSTNKYTKHRLLVRRLLRLHRHHARHGSSDTCHTRVQKLDRKLCCYAFNKLRTRTPENTRRVLSASSYVRASVTCLSGFKMACFRPTCYSTITRCCSVPLLSSNALCPAAMRSTLSALYGIV